MFGIVLLIFASLTIMLLIPLLVTVKIGKNVAEVFCSILVGTVTFYLNKLVFEQFEYRMAYKLFPYDSVIWSNRWIYGIIHGVMTSLFIWIVLSLVLFVFHQSKKWSNDESRNAIVGIAIGTLDAYWVWGSYLIQLANRCIHGISIADQGLEIDYMVNQLVQCVLTFVLYVGFVYAIRYGVAVKLAVFCTVIVILIHTIVQAFLYWIPYRMNLSMWLATVFYAIMAFITFYLGRKLLRKADSKNVSDFEN